MYHDRGKLLADPSAQTPSPQTQTQPSSALPVTSTTTRTTYLVVGGGTAGFAAIEEILKRDPSGKVIVASVIYSTRLPF